MMVLTKKDLWDKLVSCEEFLALNHAAIEEEIDDGDDDWRRLIWMAKIVRVPLHDNE